MTTAYLAPIAWYREYLALADATIDSSESYVKQTNRNRCTIAMPDGPANLIVPVEGTSKHLPIREIRISEHGNWRHHHWNAIRTAYGKSPFFEFYADEFAPFYERRNHDYLLDFNMALHNVVCQLIDMEQTVAPNQQRQEPYYQVFASRLGFLSGLSVIDLLFNMGPESIFYLK